MNTIKTINKLLLTIILILISSVVFPQATLKGKVTDKETSEALIGTNVFIKGTTNGTMADINGNFVLTGIEPGTYELVCSFISYTTVAKTFTVKGNETLVYNFELSSSATGLDDVVVKAKAITNSENAIMSIQMKSATSVNGISAKEMTMNGDKTAAASLKRVSGITVQDGKYIYVRGLGDRYSRTDLNGAMVPSMDPEKNNIQLDLFPSNIVDNIMVYKTFSPQLPANFAGGYVNVVTKKFPEEFMLNFSMSSSYNTNASFNKDFLTYEGGKTDFLGFDDGTRAIPDAALGNIPFRYQDDEKLDNITRSFNKVMKPSTNYAPLNHDFKISFGDNKKLFHKKLGYIVSYSYNRDFRYYENGENGRYSLTESTSSILQKDLHYTDRRGIDYVLWSLMASASLELNDNSNISLNLIRNQGGSSVARYQEGWNDYHEVNVQTRTLQYSQRSFSAQQLIGDHNFNNLQISWQLSHSVSKQDQPDLRFFTNIIEVNSDNDSIYIIDPAKQSVPVRYWRFMNEGNYDAKVDLTQTYSLFGNDQKLRYGLKSMHKNRSFSERRFDIIDNNNSYHGSIHNYLNDNNIGMNIDEYPQKYGVYIQDATQLSNSYNATQNLYAAYLFTNQKFGNLNLLYGLRMETTDIFLQSAKQDYPIGKLQNIDFLPALNITYKLAKNMNLRAAYTRTLARPSFRELAPYASFEFAGDFTLIGNENLKRTLIDNIDFRYEYAMKPGELISLDLFYKGFKNPIERTFVATAGNNELTFMNSDRADLYGIEFEFRKNLDFINALRNFKAGLNMSFINSIVNIPSEELNVIQATDPSAASYRSMYGQSPYIINAYLNYKNEKNDIDARIVYNVTGRRLSIVVQGGTPNVYEMPRNSMDFIFNKGLGEQFTLSFKAKNLLNDDFVKTYSYKGKEYNYSSYKLGRTFSLGINYSF